MVDINRLARKVLALIQPQIDDAIARQANVPPQNQRFPTLSLRVEESGGSPSGPGISKLVVSNGTLSISGSTATITTGGGGSGDNQYMWHVDGADLSTGELAVKYNVSGSDTLNTVRIATTATCDFDMLKNSVSQGSVSVTGSNTTASVSTSYTTGDILTIDVTAVTTAGDLTVIWVP